MSRIGKLPVTFSDAVKIELDGLKISASGPKGEVVKLFNGPINIAVNDNKIEVNPLNDTKHAKAMWGTARSIINGIIEGVTNGITQELELNGVGYRAAVKDNYLNLALAKSHNTKIAIPSYLKVSTPKPTTIIVEGADKEKLGQFIALLIKQRPPEPYKGKGIKRKNQYIQRKEGKKTK